MKKIYHLESDQSLINYFSHELDNNYEPLTLEEFVTGNKTKSNNILLIGDLEEEITNIKDDFGKLNKFSKIVIYTDNTKLEQLFRLRLIRGNSKYAIRFKGAYQPLEMIFFIKNLI